MASIENDILQNIVGTLRASGEFTAVSLGEPRVAEKGSIAVVLMDTSERVDNSKSRLNPDTWMRLAVRVLIRTHSASVGEGVSRVTSLAGAAAEALLADETRGGLCSSDVVGRGTEIVKLELADSKGELREMTLLLRCHYLLAGAAGEYFAATLDGQELFSSGPGELICESWPRETIRRGFSGLGGEILLDMGRRSRRLKQHGVLRADTQELLQLQICVIEEMNDGLQHMMIDADGIIYQKVILEKFEKLTAVQKANVCSCEYEIIYRQLP